VVVDPVRVSAQLVVRALEAGTAPVRELARLGSDSLLTALLAVLGGADRDEQQREPPGAAGNETGMSPAEVINRGLLAGHGRYTRLEVADRAGISSEQARRLWRAVGFPEADDDQRVFTSADVAALTDAAGLLTAEILDTGGLVELARPFGHLLSRLAAAHTSFLSDVLGARIAAGHLAEDPASAEQMAAQAVLITQELLPVLERTTVYVWRRHLAAEAGRALLPAATGWDERVADRRAAVGFIDISGYTRLSRNLDLTDVAVLLERFETVVGDTVLAHGGRVIKNLGDEVLFVTEEPASAAQITLRLLEQIDTDPDLPPVHAGLAFGPVLHRSGDVFGPVVNIAARIASLARPGTIRTDTAMATALADSTEFTLAARAPRRVRGYLQLRTYRLRRTHPQVPTDPAS